MRLSLPPLTLTVPPLWFTVPLELANLPTYNVATFTPAVPLMFNVPRADTSPTLRSPLTVSLPPWRFSTPVSPGDLPTLENPDVVTLPLAEIVALPERTNRLLVLLSRLLIVRLPPLVTTVSPV